MQTIKNLLKNKTFRVCLLLAVLTYPFTSDFKFFYTKGVSMYPTYAHGELLLIYKRSSLGEGWTPDRGMVVVVTDEKDGDTLIKRVVGLEGEHIKIQHGKIYIDGEKHQDPWTYQDITYWLETEEERSVKPKKEWLFFNTQENVGTVPKGYVWVIGDNRDESWMGLVRLKDIKGWVMF